MTAFLYCSSFNRSAHRFTEKTRLASGAVRPLCYNPPNPQECHLKSNEEEGNAGGGCFFRCLPGSGLFQNNFRTYFSKLGGDCKGFGVLTVPFDRAGPFPSNEIHPLSISSATSQHNLLFSLWSLYADAILLKSAMARSLIRLLKASSILRASIRASNTSSSTRPLPSTAAMN